MDQSRFDDLIRRLGAGATRREGLKAALGGLLGVGIAALPASEGETKRRHKKKRTRMTCSPDKPCPDGLYCLDLGGGKGQCLCDAGSQPPCGTTCCGDGQTCDTGGRSPVCRCDDTGQPACNGVCCYVNYFCAEDGACHRGRAGG